MGGGASWKWGTLSLQRVTCIHTPRSTLDTQMVPCYHFLARPHAAVHHKRTPHHRSFTPSWVLPSCLQLFHALLVYLPSRDGVPLVFATLSRPPLFGRHPLCAWHPQRHGHSSCGRSNHCLLPKDPLRPVHRPAPTRKHRADVASPIVPCRVPRLLGLSLQHWNAACPSTRTWRPQVFGIPHRTAGRVREERQQSIGLHVCRCASGPAVS